VVRWRSQREHHKVAFGIGFVAVLLAFMFAVPNPTNQQFEVIRIVPALATGGVAATIPGFLTCACRLIMAASKRRWATKRT
jgi:hypothetical protein